MQNIDTKKSEIIIIDHIPNSELISKISKDLSDAIFSINSIYGDSSAPSIILSSDDSIKQNQPQAYSSKIKFGTLGLIKPQEVDTILSSLNKISDSIINVTKIPKNLKNEIELTLKNIKAYVDFVKGGITSTETNKYIGFWIKIANKLSAILKEIPELSMEDFLQEHINGDIKSFKIICSKIRECNKISENEKDKPKRQNATLSKMNVDWLLIDAFHTENPKIEDLDVFASEMIDTVSDIESTKNALIGVYSMLISFINNSQFNLDSQLNLPKIKEKLFKILNQHINNPEILEPLHHVLNYLDLSDREIVAVINAMSNKYMRDSQISIALLGFYNRLKDHDPDHIFFKEQKELAGSIIEILNQLKNDPDDYNELIKALTNQIPPSKLNDNLHTKYIKISNLIARIVIDPEIYESPLLNESNSRIGIELEGRFQPGQDSGHGPKLPIIQLPIEFKLGVDGSGAVQELRTNFLDARDAHNASLQAYLRNSPSIIRFIQTNFNTEEKVKMSALHIHFDTKIHPDFPKLWRGRNNSGHGIVGNTWESRDHGLTGFTAPEYFVQFLYVLISTKNRPDIQDGVEILKGNIGTYFLKEAPLASLLMQSNQNLFSQLISKYTDFNEVLALYTPEESTILLKSPELKQNSHKNPEIILKALNSTSVSENLLSLSEVIAIMDEIDFESLDDQNKSIYARIIRKFSTDSDADLLNGFIISIFQNNLNFSKIEYFEVSLLNLGCNNHTDTVVNILNAVFDSANITDKLVNEIDLDSLDETNRKIIEEQKTFQNKISIFKISGTLNKIYTKNKSKQILEFIEKNLNSPDKWNDHNQTQRINTKSILTEAIHSGNSDIVLNILSKIASKDNYHSLIDILNQFKKNEDLVNCAKLLISIIPFDPENNKKLFEIIIQKSPYHEIKKYFNKNTNQENFSTIGTALSILAKDYATDLVLDLIEKFGNEQNCDIFKAGLIQTLLKRHDQRVIKIVKKYFNNSEHEFFSEMINTFNVNDDVVDPLNTGDKYCDLFEILDAILTPQTAPICAAALTPLCWILNSEASKTAYTNLIQKNTTSDNFNSFIEIYKKLFQSGNTLIGKEFVEKYISNEEITKFGEFLFSLAANDESNFVKDLLDKHLQNIADIYKIPFIFNTLTCIFNSGQEEWVLKLMQENYLDIDDLETRKLIKLALSKKYESEVYSITEKYLTIDNFHFLYQITKSFSEENLKKITNLVKSKFIPGSNKGNEAFIMEFIIEQNGKEEIKEFVEAKITGENFVNCAIEIAALSRHKERDLVVNLIKKYGTEENSDTFKNSLAILLEEDDDDKVFKLVNQYISPSDDQFYSNLINRFKEKGKYSLLLSVLNQILPPNQILKNSPKLNIISQYLDSEHDLGQMIELIQKALGIGGVDYFAISIKYLVERTNDENNHSKLRELLLKYVNSSNIIHLDNLLSDLVMLNNSNQTSLENQTLDSSLNSSSITGYQKVVIEILNKNLNQDNFPFLLHTITLLADIDTQIATDFIIKFVNKDSIVNLIPTIMELSNQYGGQIFESVIENSVTESNFRSLFLLLENYHTYNPEKTTEILNRNLNSKNIVYYMPLIINLIKCDQWEAIKNTTITSIKGDLKLIGLFYSGLLNANYFAIAKDIFNKVFDTKMILKSKTLELLKQFESQHILTSSSGDVFSEIVNLINNAILDPQRSEPSPEDLSHLFAFLKSNANYFNKGRYSTIINYLEQNGYQPLIQDLNIHNLPAEFARSN